MTTDFFLRFLVPRNYKIQKVVHVERKSVVLPSGCLEASWRHFFIRQSFGLFTQKILLFIDKLQKLSLRSL